jgi:hypothetical protein
MKYFVIVDPESTDAFLDASNLETTAPTVYDSEAEAIAAAKNFSALCYVVKAVVSVTPVEKHKVTKLA